MKNKLLLILIILLSLMLFVGCQRGAIGGDTIVWRFGHEETPGSIQDIYSHEFKRLVEEKSNGKIMVEIYRAGEIGEVTDYLEFTQGGLLQFCILNPGTTATTIPENNIFYNHFLMPEKKEDIKELLRTSKAIEMLNEINLEEDLYILDWFYEGFNAWTADKVIRSPQDFRGVKIRTMASPLIVSSYQAYSANPTPMSYTEVYSGLQLKQIDAQVNPVFAIQEMKFYEVQDYIILAKQDGFFASLAANPDFFYELDDETKSMLLEIVEELNDFIIDTQESVNEERLEMIKESSDIEIIELTDEEREVFREAAMPVREIFLKSVGEKGVDILRLIEEEAQEIIEKNKE